MSGIGCHTRSKQSKGSVSADKPRFHAAIFAMQYSVDVRSRSFKVIDGDANRQLTYDILLVITGN